MISRKVIIYAGTTEGRCLAEYLLQYGVRVHVCVATAYGESLLKEDANLTVTHERQDVEAMQKLMENFMPDYIIDATHPYAKEVTLNLQKACESYGMEARYLRLIRTSSKEKKQDPDCVWVSDISEAVEYLAQTEGKILATTGSKELEAYTRIPNYKDRVCVRVLSVKNVVDKCEELGFAGKNLICMQGPFSMELNLAMLRNFQISYLVTKESGSTGGYEEKCEAARRAGVKMVVIGRPSEETGRTYEEMCAYLAEELELETCCEKMENVPRKISLVGIGTGSEETFTIGGKRICQSADLLIGAKRMLLSAAGNGQATFQEYQADKIAEYLLEHPEYRNIAVALSGDPGFYSGAKRLKEVLEEKVLPKDPKMTIEIIPGISSVIYLSAKLGVSWEDAVFSSVHGRKANLITLVRKYRKLFVLAASAETVREIGNIFTDYGYGDLKVCIGVDLSYDTEQIMIETMKDCASYDGNSLAVLYIENEVAGQAVVTHGISDDCFIRGKVPMTKEEVRTVSLSKMRIQSHSVIYDVGAGTGSVAVEAALQADQGQVYAIEWKEEATKLILENQRKFGADNLTVVQGMAPEALRELPAPDIVFIGGSKGHLSEILDTVAEKNPKARIVINAITLETLSEAIEYCKKKKHLDEEVVQVQISKAGYIGNYHMMTGQNPVYIISFTLDS